ncbi:MAG TPA: type VI secretion system tip protein TssI/VgrG [Minicystis sp.]|nr:type VI secretion system tip protein TssI/VgrG [Minicystis sp.]
MHTLKIDGTAGTLHVIHFVGFEALNELFAFDVTFVAPDGAVSFADVARRAAHLTLRSGDEPRDVHGVVARLERAAPTAERATYRASIVPSVHALRLRRTSRIFQDLPVPEIAKRVLAAAGVPPGGYRLALSGSYVPRTYCVQYRESDWDFLLRLAEEEGIHAYFDHASGADVLVFADAKGAHAAIPGTSKVPFRPPSGALKMVDHVTTLTVVDEVRPGKATLRDYDFKRPTVLLEGTKSGPSDVDVEVYDHPGGFTTPGDASTVAGRRFEEAVTPSRTARGTGTVARMLPGATFDLVDHPTDGFEGPWLVARVEHEGGEAHLDGGAGEVRYENHFDALPAGVPLRMPRLTKKPLVSGVQTATVIGPPGEEIHVDVFGRIRVVFHWDREPKGEANTCWIRVAQPWAGPGYGATFIPRVGHEVVVAFEEGDPDRPLVTASVHHGTNVPPYALPGERTKTTIKSSSSPGGGGFNELRFEDQAGREEVYVHAQKDYRAEVLEDETRTIGRDAALAVTNDRTKTVGVDETITIGANETITIGADIATSIGGGVAFDVAKSMKGTVEEDADLRIGKTFTQVVGSSMTVSVDGDVSESFAQAATEQVGKGKNVSVGESFTLAVKKDLSVAVDGDAREDVGKEKTVTVGTKFTLSCGDAKVTIKKNGDIEIDGKQITLNGSGPIKVHGSKLEVSSDGTVKVQASGNVKVSGGSVDIN